MLREHRYHPYQRSKPPAQSLARSKVRGLLSADKENFGGFTRKRTEDIDFECKRKFVDNECIVDGEGSDSEGSYNPAEVFGSSSVESGRPPQGADSMGCEALRKRIDKLEQLVLVLSDKIKAMSDSDQSRIALNQRVNEFLNAWRAEFVCWHGSPWYRYGTRYVCRNGQMNCHRIHCVHSLEELRADVVAYIRRMEGTNIPLLTLLQNIVSNSSSAQCKSRAAKALGILEDMRVALSAHAFSQKI